jgi:hypothetical protein
MKFYCSFNKDLLFDNIEPYDFLEPINLLSEYYKDTENTYLSNILKIQTLEKKYIELDTVNNDLNTIILYYSMCRKNNCLLVFNLSNTDTVKNKNKIIESIGNYGNIYATKQLQFNEKEYINMLHQAFSCKYINKPEYYKKKFNITSENNILVILVELEDNIKNELYSNKNQFQHILAYTNIGVVIKLSKLFFCNNSLKFLKHQDLENHISWKMKKSFEAYNTFSKWIHENLLLIDQIRPLIFSGTVLYTYGFRSSNDIDGEFLHIPKNAKTPDLIKKVNKYFYEDKHDFEIEVTYPGCPIWKEKWYEKEKLIQKAIGVDVWHNLYFDPKYHFYYMGMKLLDIDYEIKWKQTIKSDKYKPYVNMIKLREKYDFDFELPIVPKKTRRSQEPIEKYKFLKIIQRLFKTRYNDNISIQELEKKLKFEVNM